MRHSSADDGFRRPPAPAAGLGLAALLIILPAASEPAAATTPPDVQIAAAVAAAPEDRRAGATVLGYSASGELVRLREGENELICLADDPTDERFQVTCYHQSLEPYMARGRELKKQGVASVERLAIRHREADAGELAMPEEPATLFNLGGPLDLVDWETGQVTGGRRVWSIYIPYATEADTGLPTTPQTPGAPWIMRPGTASAHIMVVHAGAGG